MGVFEVGETTTYTPQGYAGPVGPLKDRPVVTSVRVCRAGGHDHVHVWNRGGKAGVLVVDAGDGERIALRLFGGQPVDARVHVDATVQP